MVSSDNQRSTSVESLETVAAPVVASKATLDAPAVVATAAKPVGATNVAPVSKMPLDALLDGSAVGHDLVPVNIRVEKQTKIALAGASVKIFKAGEIIKANTISVEKMRFLSVRGLPMVLVSPATGVEIISVNKLPTASGS
jgi:hypothetical protein